MLCWRISILKNHILNDKTTHPSEQTHFKELILAELAGDELD